MLDNSKEKRLRRCLYGCIIVYIITLLLSFYHNYQQQDYNALGMGVVAIFTPLIVPVTFKLFHFKPVYEIYIVSTIFMYFASLVGSTFHWYSIAGFDKVLHFFSGFLATIVAVIIYFVIKKSNEFSNKSDYHIFLIFINSMNLAIAVLWEFYEYAILVFFQNDAINHYTSGVHDSMTDMLCAGIAGLILTMFIYRYYKTKRSNFFIDIYEKFYIKNMQQK